MKIRSYIQGILTLTTMSDKPPFWIDLVLAMLVEEADSSIFRYICPLLISCRIKRPSNQLRRKYQLL